jgi:hypothetical protein
MDRREHLFVVFVEEQSSAIANSCQRLFCTSSSDQRPFRATMGVHDDERMMNGMKETTISGSL